MHFHASQDFNTLHYKQGSYRGRIEIEYKARTRRPSVLQQLRFWQKQHSCLAEVTCRWHYRSCSDGVDCWRVKIEWSLPWTR
jgi:hypothetical protein